MKPLFKIGDRVTIKKDLLMGHKYGSETFTQDMFDHRGKTTAITMVVPDSAYLKHPVGPEYKVACDKSAWWWTPEMFES